ncbi:unnamed protein product [Sphagnum troendelagicum]
MGSWEEIAVRWTSLKILKLMETAVSVPAWEYFSLVSLLTLAWLYFVLDFHFLADLLCGLRGDPIRLFYNSKSKIPAQVLQQCRVLKERYAVTPWLSSPHLQTLFLHVNGRPPPVKYDRQLYSTADGGTIGLDWVISPHAVDGVGITSAPQSSASDETPMVVIIPGLTSDSDDAYVKHIAYSSVMKGWRTLVANHRGLGGVSITSDRFYNAGWTEDLRTIIHYVHEKYPRAPLFTIGTSIGANILVKYLGEEGVATPVGAAAAVCSPWDLVVCDRFMSRKTIQKIYNMVLATGLRQYANMHQSVMTRIADWDLLTKSKTVRDFDQHCTRHTGKYETVDTYYRHCSSAYYLANVAVPLLCFNSLDDPVCTKEAIPWDECIANPNVVLAVTKHGGHLGFFEGITAHSVWWVRALTEYMTVMLPSPLMHKQSEISVSNLNTAQGSDLDKGPYLRMSDSGEVAAEDLQPASFANTESRNKFTIKIPEELRAVNGLTRQDSAKKLSNTTIEKGPAQKDSGRRQLESNDRLLKGLIGVGAQNRRMMWLLVYVAVVTSCPLIGSALFFRARGRIAALTKRLLK